MWRQPKTVWSVAFACVIAFMGIGLVDPILKPIADDLGAGPSQVSLLFTSYMAVMGLAMLVTGWVSSRTGAKRTLLLGLVIIIVGAGLAGAQDTVGGHRRLPRGLGSRQRPVHRHRAGHHRQRRQRVGRPGDHPLRSRAGCRHRGRAAARRLARRTLVAVAVLGRERAHDDRLRRDHHHPARHAAHRPPHPALAHRCVRCPTAGCSPSGSPRCSTTSASSPCWPGRRSRWRWAPTRSGWSSSAGASCSPSPRSSSLPGSSDASARCPALVGRPGRLRGRPRGHGARHRAQAGARRGRDPRREPSSASTTP